MRESTLNNEDRSMEGIASEALLNEGVPLDAIWHRANADIAPIIFANGVAVVLSLEITMAVAEQALALTPRVLVFLEDGFAGRDAVKANVFTNAKNLGVTMKTI